MKHINFLICILFISSANLMAGSNIEGRGDAPKSEGFLLRKKVPLKKLLAVKHKSKYDLKATPVCDVAISNVQGGYQISVDAKFQKCVKTDYYQAYNIQYALALTVKNQYDKVKDYSHTDYETQRARNKNFYSNEFTRPTKYKSLDEINKALEVYFDKNRGKTSSKLVELRKEEEVHHQIVDAVNECQAFVSKLMENREGGNRGNPEEGNGFCKRD